ncbi:putative Piwi domain, ribonuclease H superfamily [Helianthus annuus]|nr:putative Piwi domain, ribonuclease H superfamily [Helianthus annuus]
MFAEVSQFICFSFYTGTVIDNKVCHPRNNDFYMCAHAGMITAVSLSASSLLMFIRCSSKEPGYVKTTEGIRNNADDEVRTSP